MATPPSTSYAVKDVTAGALLSDWTSFADVANMPAGWKALVDTADGTKGRVFLDDGVTQLAMDPVRFENDGEFRFLIPTFSGVTPTTIRIYPPVAANASVAASDTYGSYNAYDEFWKMYLPLDEDVGNEYRDHTSNMNHGQGVPTALPAVDGQVGPAADFDGVEDRITIEDDDSLSFGDASNDSPFSVSAWVYYVGTGGNGPSAPIINKYESSHDPFNGEWALIITSSDKLSLQCLDSGPVDRVRATSNAAISKNTQHLLVGVYDGSSADAGITLYIDGVAVADTDGGGGGSYVAMHNRSSAVDIGANAYAGTPTFSGFMNGLIDEAQIHSVARSADWWAEEFAQTDDNSGYWGTWVFVEFVPPPLPEDIVAFILGAKSVSAHTLGVVQLESQTLGVKQLSAHTLGQ